MADRKARRTGGVSADIAGWRARARAQWGEVEHWSPEPPSPPPDPKPGQIPVYGYLELSAQGWGQLRVDGLPGRDDPFVPARLVERLGLRLGDLVEGLAEEGRKGLTLRTVWLVNGHGSGGLERRPLFDGLTAIHPFQAIRLGHAPDAITGRLMDLIAPVGRGQRGLIVAPPQAGKTTVLEHIGRAVAADPELTLLVCLVGERPEEATALRRSVEGEVLVADLDAPQEVQAAVVDLALAHARRLTEEGSHVVVLLDSLTRLARVHNLAAPTRGGSRTLSGGMDASALVPVRKVFGAARAIEDGGSLTLIATCLVDTGSRLDSLVYEEFKGTGNMEVHLDRKLAQLGLFPAVNIARSSTRREGLLLDETTLDMVNQVRRVLVRLDDDLALAELLSALKTYPDNMQALEAMLYP